MAISDKPWCGVAITESFDDLGVLEKMHIVTTKVEHLEGEEGIGTFHFHKVEVNDADIDQVVALVSSAIKPSWFLHLISGTGDRMKVVFHGKYFDVKKGDDQALREVVEYGKQHGVHEDQLQLYRLFDNPYDD